MAQPPGGGPPPGGRPPGGRPPGGRPPFGGDRQWGQEGNMPTVKPKKKVREGDTFTVTGVLRDDKNNDFLKDINYIRKKALFPKRVLCYDFLEEPERFNSIRPILLNDFTPKFSPLEKNKGLYQIINNNNSVCVSIRRGDYINSQYSNTFYICDENYFRLALNKIKQLVNNPVIIFFSDDIEWVKKNINTDILSYYESGNDPVWEKLRLMYSCKHFIISNSTFSWWAQYLSRNTNKIVISPDHWTNDHTKNAKHLISNDFITIPCAKTSK